MKTIIITRKMELRLIGEDKERNFNRLMQIQKLIHKAANYVVNEQIWNMILKEKIMEQDESWKKLQEVEQQLRNIQVEVTDKKERKEQRGMLGRLKKVLLTDLLKNTKEDYEKMLGTSEMNSTYRGLSKNYPELPSCVRGVLNYSIKKCFNNDMKEIRQGKRLYRNYKEGMPIPFDIAAMKIIKDENEYLAKIFEGIEFEISFGRDKSNNKIIIDRIIDSTYKPANSQIQIKKGKIFLLLAIKMSQTNCNLKEDIIVGVDLGLNIPAFCISTNDEFGLSIGNRDDFLRERIRIQRRRKDLQKNLKWNMGGKGRKKKLKALERFREKERNFTRTYNHMVSFKIIEYVLSKEAKYINLELLKGISQEQKDSFVLRNWSYFELQTMIQQKAEKYGIEVRFIDPYHTSQTCAECGHYEEEQRIKQAIFKCKNKSCKNFDIEINADKNAAMNIAKSKHFVVDLKDCQFHKRVA